MIRLRIFFQKEKYQEGQSGTKSSNSLTEYLVTFRFTHLADTSSLSQSILVVDSSMCKLVDCLGKSEIALKLQNLENHQLNKGK